MKRKKGKNNQIVNDPVDRRNIRKRIAERQILHDLHIRRWELTSDQSCNYRRTIRELTTRRPDPDAIRRDTSLVNICLKAIFTDVYVDNISAGKQDGYESIKVVLITGREEKLLCL